MTPVHSCVRWCFALKGECHKIFASGFFHESFSHKPLKFSLGSFQMFTKISVASQGSPLYQWHWRYRCCCCYRRQIFRGERSGNKFRNLVQQAANTKICGLTKFVIFANLPHVWQFANLLFVDPIFFAICRFVICWSTFFCELKTTENPQIRFFLLSNTYLKCSNSKFYQIKNSAKQTCCRLLDNFAKKRGNFLKRCLILSVLWWKICRLAHQQNLQIWNLGTRILQKFAELQ